MTDFLTTHGPWIVLALVWGFCGGLTAAIKLRLNPSGTPEWAIYLANLITGPAIIVAALIFRWRQQRAARAGRGAS